MSWSGFKKNVNRATTQVMMKTGHVEKTSDREYEVEERRYRSLESAAMRLQKEAKGYLDSLRAMTASQMRIAETIDAFYGDSGARDGVSRSYKQAVEDLDAETVKALDGPYRCVSPTLLQHIAETSCLPIDQATVRQVERDLNWITRSRSYTRTLVAGQDCPGMNAALKLINYVYRTTVLEPINRFCAYFPDINECIKKRNHKLLDYDSMRSKVKKLTEKPDKDPGKLPRTERETEMVHLPPSISLDHAPLSSVRTSAGLAKDQSFIDLTVPSPPKYLQRSKIAALRQVNPPQRSSSLGVRAGFSDNDVPNHSHMHPANRAQVLQRGIVQHSHSTQDSFASGTHYEDPSSCCKSHPRDTSDRGTRAVSLPVSTKAQNATTSKPSSERNKRGYSLEDAAISNPVAIRRPAKQSHIDPSRRMGGLFCNPSELEEIMAPLRAEFLCKEADKLDQAKAAYEQLNEQLTSELPQLIDLRVPYLDPSFEALVKIQLRFCAEAYSRMAQVQQYLDASTRDQYASGDLDARVEEVLGQIRDLSIAGTV